MALAHMSLELPQLYSVLRRELGRLNAGDI